MRISPRIWNAHPEANENTKQLNHIRVSDRVESTEERVKHSDARGEND